MDELGQRIDRDNALIEAKRSAAEKYEREARQLRREADEIERQLEIARRS